MSSLIDGKALAQKYNEQTAKEIAALKTKGVQPGLAVVLISDDPASQIYVQNKQKTGAALGIQNFLKKFPAAVKESEVLKHIDALNKDAAVHGILVQLPLPTSLNAKKILNQIDPKKDVDGLHPENMGRLLLNLPGLKPCTPQGILHLIQSTGVQIGGKNACVIGRSDIVGKPTAILLLQNDATVTICHSQTGRLRDKIGEADIVVAAVGKPKFIHGDWIKSGAIVIDVGIHILAEGKMVGDVDFEGASKRAQAITPVPGGVGPMTIAMLMKNTVEACK